VWRLVGHISFVGPIVEAIVAAGKAGQVSGLSPSASWEIRSYESWQGCELVDEE
jgi:hypothetical protein